MLATVDGERAAGDRLDDIPPLEDMSAELRRVAKGKEKTTSGGIGTRNTITKQKTSQSDGLSLNSNLPKNSAKKSMGLKSGFLNTKSSSAVRPSMGNGLSKLPILKPTQSKDESLRISEVQNAMMTSMPLLDKKEWMTPELLERIEQNPVLSTLFADPDFQLFTDKMQRDPQKAMQEYAHRQDYANGLQQFMGLMGVQFDQLATQKTKEKQVEKVRQMSAQLNSSEQALIENVLQDDELQAILTDPTIQKILNAMRTQPEQTPRELCNPSPTLMIKLRKLMNAGLLQWQITANFTNLSAIALLHIINEKQTNLCVSADLTSTEAILKLANDVGPYICILKTHADIIQDFDDHFVSALQQLATRYKFMIFEDRKFADIGVHKIASWAHIVNAHSLPGEGIITGLKKVGKPLQRGLLLLAQMSSKGSLFTTEYTQQTLQLAEHHKEFVIGFIAQERLTDELDYLYLTPGVGLDNKGDSMGQQYRTPEDVIVHSRCDVIIVGRGIYEEGRDVVQEAKRYRDAGWTAYERRVTNTQ